MSADDNFHQQQEPAPVQQSDAREQSNNKPLVVLPDGMVKANMWQNQGQHGLYRTTTFSKTFKDQQGNYRDTQSFTGADLLKISELAREAYDLDKELRREEFMRKRNGASQNHATPDHSQ